MLCKSTVLLKEIDKLDLPYFLKWRNSEDVRPFTREYKPLTMENQTKWYESLTDSNHIMFSIHNNSILVGCCGLTHINYKDGHAEVSIYLGDKNWQGKGIASTAIQLLLQYGFMELRLHRIFAVIFEYNKTSIKLFESNKFKFDGKHRDAKFWNGKYHDELVYSILEKEYGKQNEL